MASASCTPLERGVQSRIVTRLNKNPDTLVRVRSADAVGHVVGDPDVYGSVNGRHVEIEVKVGSNTPSDKQWFELRKWASKGACCCVCYSAAEAVIFQSEVLAGRGEGQLLVFGAAAECVRQGKHGAGYKVPIATISGRGRDTEVLEC